MGYEENKEMLQTLIAAYEAVGEEDMSVEAERCRKALRDLIRRYDDKVSMP